MKGGKHTSYDAHICALRAQLARAICHGVLCGVPCQSVQRTRVPAAHHRFHVMTCRLLALKAGKFVHSPCVDQSPLNLSLHDILCSPKNQRSLDRWRRDIRAQTVGHAGILQRTLHQPDPSYESNALYVCLRQWQRALLCSTTGITQVAHRHSRSF